MIDVADGLHIWSETYERQISEIFAIQDDIARSIAGALRIELRVGFSGPAPPPTAMSRHTICISRERATSITMRWPDWNWRPTASSEPIAADPGFAAAHAQLALTYGLLAYYQLHACRGGMAAGARQEASARWPSTRNWRPARRHWDSRSGYTTGNGRKRSGRCAARSRWTAIPPRRMSPWRSPHWFRPAVWRRPRPNLRGPSNWTRSRTWRMSGRRFASLAQGRYPEAIAQYQRAAAINPSHADTQWDLGMAYAFAGRKEEAMRQFRLGGQIRSGGDWIPGPIEYALLGDAAGARGQIAMWRHFDHPAAHLRSVLLRRARGCRAGSGWLEKAYAARDPQIVWVKIDPRFAKVRGDARIAALIAKIGL